MAINASFLYCSSNIKIKFCEKHYAGSKLSEF